MVRVAWVGNERREIERCRVLVPCKLEVGSEVWLGKTDDISLKGACFLPAEGDISRALRNASGIFELLLPSAVFRVDCRVVRLNGAGIGLQFIGHEKTSAYAALLDFLETQLSQVR